MTQSIDILKLFEGLNREQTEALRARVMPTLANLREEITTGNGGTNHKGAKNMNDNLDLSSLPDDVRASVERALAELERQNEALPEVQQARRTEQQQADAARRSQLDEQEAAEMAVLPRGRNNAVQRQQVRQKYLALRNPAQPVKDPEIETARQNNTLVQLYRQRRRAIEQRRDISTATKLHLNAELEATFRREGLV